MKRYAAMMAGAVLALTVATTAGFAAKGDKAEGQGYLSGAQVVDSAKFLPPPPALGSVQFAADEDVYLRMRLLDGTDRWALAVNDDKLDVGDLMQDFSCAMGFVVTAQSAPKLAALAKKAANDAGNAIGSGKSYFKRPRPLLHNDLPICVPREKYAGSYSYPSGHSTLSWNFASILMALLPERATAIADRARAFGESRAVCGVHWASDVEGGRLAASTVFAAQQSSPAFQRDLAVARQEVAKLSKSAPKPDPASCKALDKLLPRPW